eukprot:COSAG01_NODE_172_length_23108_cov_26.690496_17_plen_59_part_00
MSILRNPEAGQVLSTLVMQHTVSNSSVILDWGVRTRTAVQLHHGTVCIRVPALCGQLG